MPSDVEWTHVICNHCWRERRGDREPIRQREKQGLPCCYCGETTISGILVRDDPTLLRCKGESLSHMARA